MKYELGKKNKTTEISYQSRMWTVNNVTGGIQL